MATWAMVLYTGKLDVMNKLVNEWAEAYAETHKGLYCLLNLVSSLWFAGHTTLT